MNYDYELYVCEYLSTYPFISTLSSVLPTWIHTHGSMTERALDTIQVWTERMSYVLSPVS